MEKAAAEMALAALRVPYHERTTEQIGALVSWCESKGVAPGGAKVNLDQLCRAMKLEEYPDETVLFRQGDPGSTYYIVFSGEVAIFVNSVNSVLAALNLMQARRIPAVARHRAQRAHVADALEDAQEEAAAAVAVHQPAEAARRWPSSPDPEARSALVAQPTLLPLRRRGRPRRA